MAGQKTMAAPLTDEQLDRQIAALDAKMKARLDRFTAQEVSRANLANVRPGGRTWEKYQRIVMQRLHQADTRIEDCEEAED